MAAWEVTERVRRDDDSRRRPGDESPSYDEHGQVIDAVAGPTDAAEADPQDVHLDDLINERSAATAERLEEEERARAAALASAPLRAATAVPSRLGRAGNAVAQGALAAVSAAGSAGAAFGSTVGSVTRSSVAGVRRRSEQRRVSRAAIAGDPRPLRRPGRRLGLAAAAALAIAAPALGTPAPWAALVGASVNGIGPARAGGIVPDDLFSPKGLGPLPSSLPPRGLGGASIALGTTADPSAAGLPTGTSDRAIPSTVLLAYQKAADRLAAEEPGCQLPWTLLAGIGKVESNHARSWSGAEHLTAAGTATPPILGPILDGSVPGTARLLDTDGGRLDGNAQFDRAVGPLQFVPGTWKLLGRDGNGDGIADPNNIWDASLAAGTFLCGDNRDLGQPAQQAAAVFAYNPSADYVRTVLAWSKAYATGAEVDLSLPTGGFALPPDVTGGTTGGFSLPLTGSGTPYADPEGSGTAPGSTGRSGTPYADPGGSGSGSGSAGGEGTAGGGTTNPGTSNPGSGNGGSVNPTPPTTQPTPPPPPAKFELTRTNDVIIERSGDVVTLSTTVHATSAGEALIRVRLGDRKDYRVTGYDQSVIFDGPGSKAIKFTLDGAYIGDAGVDGPFTLSMTQRQTKDAQGKPVSGSTSGLGQDQKTANWSADSFSDYTPSATRISDRVTEFEKDWTGQITAAAADDLRKSLENRDLVAVRTFQKKLAAYAGSGDVKPEAFTRLDKLARRYIAAAEAGRTPTEPKSPADPGRDPEARDGLQIS